MVTFHVFPTSGPFPTPQHDIVDPTLFVKTYLEVSLGTGNDFEKLRAVFGDLYAALFGANAVVAKIRAELKETKEFVEAEHALLQVGEDGEILGGDCGIV